MRKPLILLMILLIGAAPGCARNKKDDQYRGSMLSDLPFVYEMPVQQGNIITEEMVNQLKIGMTKSQVRYLLGTPLLMDIFHTNRWDYTYTMRRPHQPMQTKRLTLYFQDDGLTRIAGTIQPEPGDMPAATEQREVVVKVPDWRDNRGLITRTLNKIGVESKD
jgi:outer membrane protein assembly factor BamE